MERAYFERKGALDYQELESNPKSGGVPSSRVIITSFVVANGALQPPNNKESPMERLRRD